MSFHFDLPHGRYYRPCKLPFFTARSMFFSLQNKGLQDSVKPFAHPRILSQNQADRSAVIVLEQNAFQRVRHALPFFVVGIKCAARVPAVGVLGDDNKGAVIPRERAAARWSCSIWSSVLSM